MAKPAADYLEKEFVIDVRERRGTGSKLENVRIDLGHWPEGTRGHIETFSAIEVKVDNKTQESVIFGTWPCKNPFCHLLLSHKGVALKPIFNSSHLFDYAGGNIVRKVPDYFDRDAWFPSRYHVLCREKPLQDLGPVLVEDVCFDEFESAVLSKLGLKEVNHFWVNFDTQHLVRSFEQLLG